MPFARPSPFEIRDRMAAEVAIALPGADARQRRSVEEILVRAIAVASHEMHGHIEWVARQILPDTADDAELERHAAVWGVARLAATQAAGNATFSGVAGAIIPAGTELRRTDDARYTVLADAEIGGGGTVVAAIRAVAAGAAGNAPEGTSLGLVAPVAGVGAAAVIAAGGLAAGADAETDASLRARLLARIQNPPRGGSRTDYEAWALAVPGVERAWILPLLMGAGTVGVTFVTTGGAVPGAPLVAAVQAAIDAQRPVTADVSVFAPATQAVNLTIALDPDSVAIRSAVLAELAEFFRQEAEPGGTVRISRISAAISAAAGEVSHLMSAPAADIVLPVGTIAVLGTVTWA